MLTKNSKIGAITLPHKNVSEYVGHMYDYNCVLFTRRIMVRVRMCLIG